MADILIFILIASVTHQSTNPFDLLTPAVIYSAMIGFAVRIAAEWAKDNSSWKSAIIQLIYSIFLLYIGLFIWADYNIGMNIVYYAAVCGAFSVVIINVAMKWFEIGLSGMIRHYIHKFLNVKKDDNADI